MRKIKYTRPQAKELAKRLKEPRRFIQSISGARQVGKTTLILQVAEKNKRPYHFANADEPTLRAGTGWITSQWEETRLLADKSKTKDALLILDEVQKIPQWSETVKSLWDEDTRKKRKVKVVLLGSSPLLIGRGLTKSFAGRFETLHLPHWSFSEMKKAFGWDLKQYLFYGAYPGAAPFIKRACTLVALYKRFPDRNVYLPRCASAFPCGQTGTIEAIVRGGLFLFGTDSFLQKNRRTTSG